jgi:hypothetical protein
MTDDALKKRVKPLFQLDPLPLDILIGQAGVVLEDRLRTTSGVSARLVGVELVDAFLKPPKPVISFSEHPGEQEGVRMLYRGAMQFIRNPPAHRPIEYAEDEARLFIRLIDSLLQLLCKAGPVDDVSVTDVRQMLTRLRIPNGQRALYRALYPAGDRGLTADELAKSMDRSREQLAGVLGALGNRINKTESLEGKGAILVVLDISRDEHGDWRYRMRPVLRKALEAEGLV